MANDLVVQLGAKLDQFASDMNQAGDMADSAISRIENSFASLNPGIGLGGLTGLATGAVGSLTLLLAALQHVNSELADIGKNAEFVGVTVERFQQIQFAATQGGVSSEQATTDLRKVASLLADAKENENSLTKLLDANNIKYKDRNGAIITTNQLLTIAGDLINRFTSMPEKTKAAQQLGLSEQWVQALHDGSKAFDAIAESADAAGAVIDRSTVAKAEAFDKAWKQSTALLSSQFKAAAGDVAVFLDGLIDKAADLITNMNKANGAGVGSGQEKFNRLADSIAIAASAEAGTLSVQQLERAIEILQANKQAVAPEVFEQLARMKADTDSATAASRALLAAASKANFPGGVPTPTSRPSSANDPAENAARLAKNTKDTADQFDHAQEVIAKHTARLEADAESAGKGAAAQEELRAKAQLLTAAQAAGIPVIGKTADTIDALSKSAGAAAEALAKAKVASDTAFSTKTAFLTKDDLQIAQQLRTIYGDNIPAAMESAEAQALRFSNALKLISDTGQEINRGLFVEFGQNIRNGQNAWTAFENAGLSALGKIADKLASIAADNLWKAAFGGSGGSSFLSLLGIGGGVNANGSIAGAIGPTSVGGAPLVFGGGGYTGSGGKDDPAGIVHKGEFVFDQESVNRIGLGNLMRLQRGYAAGGPVGVSTVPNDVTGPSSGAGIVITYSPTIDARGTSTDAVAALARVLAEDRASFARRTVETVRQAKRGRQL